jgi:NAD(P)H-hydrate epimerase
MTTIDRSYVVKLYKPRAKDTHKGTYGHCLVIAGEYGKIGAAVLCAKAALRSGAGLLTAFIPKCGYEIMQRSVPEVMVITSLTENYLSGLPNLNAFDAIAVGPGIGKNKETKATLHALFTSSSQPLVIDADALNCLSEDEALLNYLPINSILTPHPKEFDRLFGAHSTRDERIKTQLQKAQALKCIIVLKGANSTIATPTGDLYVNTTGNPGMATAGMGDVLTGIISGLLAQGYSTKEASIMGVYLHGLAGDIAANKLSEEAIIASDIIAFLGDAIKTLN